MLFSFFYQSFMNKLQWNFDQNITVAIQVNVFENVVK